MKIDVIEENIIQMGVAADSFKYLLDRFEERLFEQYSVLLKKEEQMPYYYELRSDLYLFRMLLESFNNIKNNFNGQIENFYSKP